MRAALTPLPNAVAVLPADADDSRHRFGGHHQQAVRQRHTDFLRCLQDLQKLSLKFQRQVAVPRTETGPQIVRPFPAGRKRRQDLLLAGIAVFLNGFHRYGLEHHRPAHLQPVVFPEQMLHPAAQRGRQKCRLSAAL